MFRDSQRKPYAFLSADKVDETERSQRNPHPTAVDSYELAIGIEEEYEHTDDPRIAQRIALDHLGEDPHYYTKLKRCFANPYTNPDVVSGRGSGLSIIVRNRYDSEYIPPPIHRPYVVISVYTPGDPRPNLAAHAYKVNSLAIPFYDVPYEPQDVHVTVRKHLFMLVDARAIASFVASAKAQGINTVVVHCDMGKSRSSAIAAALSLYYNGTVQPFVKGKRYRKVGSYGYQTYNPNPRVFRLMVEALLGEK